MCLQSPIRNTGRLFTARTSVGRISGYFSKPLPGSVSGQNGVPGTGYLSQIVLGPFWQLVHQAIGAIIPNATAYKTIEWIEHFHLYF